MSNIDDELDRDREFSPAWKPEPGEKLIGELVGIGKRDAGYGIYRIYTIRRDDGSEVDVHAFHTVLANELDEAGATPGERIGIKYEGEVATDSGKHYHRYRVATDRPAEEASGAPADASGFAA